MYYIIGGLEMKSIKIVFLTENGEKIFYEVDKLPQQNPRGVRQTIISKKPLTVLYNIHFALRTVYSKLRLDLKIIDGLEKCGCNEGIDYKVFVL